MCVEKNGHAMFQSIPVVNSCSSSATLTATPSSIPAPGPTSGGHQLGHDAAVLSDLNLVAGGDAVENSEDLLDIACGHFFGHYGHYG